MYRHLSVEWLSWLPMPRLNPGMVIHPGTNRARCCADVLLESSEAYSTRLLRIHNSQQKYRRRELCHHQLLPVRQMRFTWISHEPNSSGELYFNRIPTLLKLHLVGVCFRQVSRYLSRWQRYWITNWFYAKSLLKCLKINKFSYAKFS